MCPNSHDSNSSANGTCDSPTCETGPSKPSSVVTPALLLVKTRPHMVSAAVGKAAVAISRRQGDWGVDGAWSYNFSKLGYAGTTTSDSGAKPLAATKVDHADHNNTRGTFTKRSDVLVDSFDRVLLSRGSGTTLRVLDLGSGSGAWLLQAKKELARRAATESLNVLIHGVTGDALPSVLGPMASSKAEKTECIEVSHFQQIGIETFPFLLTGDINNGLKEQRNNFKKMVEKFILPIDLQGESSGGMHEGYDLILSSWTFCHLIDPLGTLELWSNALAVEGELYVNDIDFSVLFEGENTIADWERDPEKRMERAFAAVSKKGEADNTFSIEFVYDDTDYRTAVKVRRISAAPIRFAPLVRYSFLHEADSETTFLDSFGRPVYMMSTTVVEE